MSESPNVSFTHRRILKVGGRVLADESAWRRKCSETQALGFDSVLTEPFWRTSRTSDDAPFDPDRFAFDDCGRETMTHAVARLAAICAEEGLSLLMDVALDRAAVGGSLAREHPDWFEPPGLALDPRSDAADVLQAKKHRGRVHAGLLGNWAHRLEQWARAGAGGFRCQGLGGMAADDWHHLIVEVRDSVPACQFLAWTPGMTAGQVYELRGAGFDATFLSLPWWDFRAAWLAEEHQRLQAVAPVIAPILEAGPANLQAEAGQQRRVWQRCIWTAALSGQAVMVSDRLIQAGAGAELQKMNEWLMARPETDAPLRFLTGPLSATTALFRGGAGVVLNPSSEHSASLDWGLVRARLPDDYGDIQYSPGLDEHLDPAGCARFVARKTSPICLAAERIVEKRKLGLGLANGARIAIEHVEPSVDGGRFPVKAIQGQEVAVEADVFMDGHDQLAVVLLWRAGDETGWHELPMNDLGNDRWRASFTPMRLGRHLFIVKAWLDTWKSYRVGLKKKLEAGTDITVDLQEGRLVLSEALQRAGRENKELTDVLRGVLESDETDVAAIISDETAQIMSSMDARPFETPDDVCYTLMVERREANYASWYELFPRSQGAAGVHGTFLDVRRRLPAIRDMGFDVLYFPPIHPIGGANRKGPNNALVAGPNDPGSPYAIGSAQGGHDAIHPELGTLEDFKALLDDARRHGLEIALDFAIQCSPDHPWLTEHRKWFSWRADGSLRYAENPPKRYEDIVNPDFYQGALQPKPQASLWRELRDVVLYWIDQGVRIFRVDNPHTKPLPFWEWMLGEVHASHPDVIFLSEAFTRPRMMYRLAKLGFSQSYTYFTWRNTKQELTSYLEELVAVPAAYSFRPNFFVNTPDINPFFLQSSGRAGFLIRAALASTLSGSWGVYNGFELCEARALPGREEYADSEKYELRSWDWDRPGNIIAEIAQLNRIRRNNPALQTHLGVQFHTIHDDQLLFFSKSTPQGDNVVLAIISLDPRNVHRAWVELPLWKWNLPDDGRLQLENLCSGSLFEMQGKHHEVELTPEQPYVLWQIRGVG